MTQYYTIIKKISGTGNNTVIIPNLSSLSIDLNTPLTPMPLPEETDEDNILVKMEGNTKTIPVAWSMKEETDTIGTDFADSTGSVASGTLTLVSAIDTDVAVVNGLSYTGVTGTKANNTEFSIDTSDTEAAADLADSITRDIRVGTTVPSVGVSATSSLGVVTINALLTGTDANSIDISSPDTTITASGATLTGGVIALGTYAIVGGAGTKDAFEQIDFWDEFAPNSVDDSYELLFYEEGNGNARYRKQGSITNIRFSISGGSPVVWDASFNFIVGDAVAAFESNSPERPSITDVTAPTSTSIKVDWKTFDGYITEPTLTNTLIKYKPLVGGSWIENIGTGITGAGERTFTISNSQATPIVANTTYIVRVANESDESADTNIRNWSFRAFVET